ncbi:MAG TPA: hypothetical protein VK152_07420 [Paludibacter sp.]|nr:hypothetical protein [Paludibacter sp.]
MKLIRLFFLCIASVFYTTAGAQAFTGDEYKGQIGLAGGGSYYLGDANRIPFNNMQAAYGGFFRYIFNTRLALKAELLGANISNPGKFSNLVYSSDFTAEFNFFDLEKNPNKPFSKPFSPYIFTGLGAMTDVYRNQILPELSIPFGVGFKVKLGNRWNAGLQWSTRVLLHSDNLENNELYDGNVHPNLNGTNLFNNDLLSTITIGVSYNILKKECDCVNSNYNPTKKKRKHKR